MTPRLAVAVNFAQFVALASHSKFSLQSQENKSVTQQFIDAGYQIQVTQDELPEELVARCPCVHERVGNDCGCVAN